MLKSIVFENFVHFKDKTTITFTTQNNDVSTTKTSPNGNPETGVQNLDDCNAFNIFVGANFCGKSTVLELIRRCMTDEINVSVTNSYNKKSVAYALCQFRLHPYDNVISGIINEPGNEYKVFIFEDESGLFLRSRSSDRSRSAYNGLVEADNTTMQAINSLFKTPGASDMTHITHLLKVIKENKETNVPLKDEPCWKTIETKYIATFPMRGIGSVQWTRSEKIREKKRNYDMACERAEVISTLLSEKHKDDIDVKFETEVFRFITYPEEFNFRESKGCISVEHRKSVFPLLKTSEGILEAKLTSLLLAHKGIKTLCLEDPDRGMHPQMIGRLKTVLHRAACNKTIIVVTHSPFFIDAITIDKTHVFSRQKSKKDDYVCFVTNALQCNILSKVSDIETLKALLFATKVLLVEGITDREVVQGIFTKYKSSMLARRRKNVNYFWRDITTYQIIPLGGYKATEKVQEFCKLINLPCCCVWDLDNVVKKEKTSDRIVKIQNINETDFTTLNKKYGGRRKSISDFVNCDEDFDTVSKSLESTRDIFIWRYGALEDAILESYKNEKEEKTFLGASNKKDLKEKLKFIQNENDRQRFYDQLMELDEIKRFITFLKKRESMKLLKR